MIPREFEFKGERDDRYNYGIGGIYYGSLLTVPTTEESVESLEKARTNNFTVPKGRYVICTRRRATRIRDKNMLDVTEDFEERRVGKYYVYVFRHETVIDMEFTIYF